MLRRLSAFSSRHSKFISGLVVLSALVLMIVSVWDDAPIVDEIPHIGAGYSYVAKGDHRLNPEHPPLAKDLAGLGVFLTSPTENAFKTRFWLEDINGQWEFGRYLIFSSGSNTEQLIKYAKLPMLLFFIALAAIIYVWALKLYGPSAALIATFLFSFSPTIMAHSRFVTTDIPALFGVMLGSFFFIKYLKNPSFKNLFLAGVMFGIAQLTKYSLFLLGPFFILLALIFGFFHPFKAGLTARLSRGINFGLSTVVLIIIGFVVIIWPYYLFHVINEPAEVQRHQTETILSSFGRRELADPVIYFSDKPVIRGMAQYGLGLLMVVQRSVGGNDTYFMGNFSNQAWKSYFPIVYFLKEPLPFWLLLVGVWIFYSTIWKKTESFEIKKIWNKIAGWIQEYFVEFSMLLWIFIYWYTSINANLNIGVRHLMPTYGFVFILLAGRLVAIAKKFEAKKHFSIYAATITVLFGWYFIENLKVFPYYLTYFNQIAGGPSGGYRYVVDSNVDWGQDLKRLADWVDENGIKKIHFDYFGWSDQEYYLKEKLVWIGSQRYRSKKEFLSENPQGGYIAVSASFYMGLSLKPGFDYLWLPLDERVATIGNSIFVWHIQP